MNLWSDYWSKIKSDPHFKTGDIPAFPALATVETNAGNIYNQSICAFRSGNFKAILCLPSEAFIGDPARPDFALPEPAFSALQAKPDAIEGKSSGISIKGWPDITNRRVEPGYESTLNDELTTIIETAVNQVYNPTQNIR